MRLRAAVDKAVSNREQYVDKFCNNLDRDITDLGKEVKEIKNQAQVCMQNVHFEFYCIHYCTTVLMIMHKFILLITKT